MNSQSQKLLNWLLQLWMKQLWPCWRDKEVEELQLHVRKGHSYLTVRSYLYQHNWQTQGCKVAAKDYSTVKFHQDTSYHNLMLGFVLYHIPWNPISNLELRWSFNALGWKVVLQSGSTLSNICWREYSLTVDAIKKQLPSRNKMSLALDGWTSTNKLGITLVTAYSMDSNLALREV